MGDKENEFIELCRQHKVKSIYAFGSSVSDKFDFQKSDIDLLVDLNISDPVDFGGNLLSLWNSLEQFFHRKVDLLTDESIRNPYLRRSIDSTKKLIYDGQREKVFV